MSNQIASASARIPKYVMYLIGKPLTKIYEIHREYVVNQVAKLVDKKQIQLSLIFQMVR